MIQEEIIKTKNMINTMLRMQKELDREIFEKKAKSVSENFSNDHLNLAIIDEIGELTHELKPMWCWWKEKQEQLDVEKVIGELVDVWHFVLMKHYRVFEKGDYTEQELTKLMSWIYKYGQNYTYIYHFLSTNYELDDVIALTFALGFEIDDVYEEYMRKNKINHERAENGY